MAAAISQTVPGEFAYAEMFDSTTEKFSGLTIENGMNMPVSITGESVIVKLDVAENHRTEIANQEVVTESGDIVDETEQETVGPILPKRYYGLTEISSDRPAKDFGKIVDNILEHLVIMGDTNIEITLEINAEASDGITKDKQRLLLENSNVLGFKDVKLD